MIDSTVDEMESGATVTNLTAAEENKDGKNETDGENSSSLSQTQVSENSKGPVEEAAGHKESEASGDSQAAQKRPAETEDENDDEGKRKKRKGIIDIRFWLNEHELLKCLDCRGRSKRNKRTSCLKH